MAGHGTLEKRSAWRMGILLLEGGLFTPGEEAGGALQGEHLGRTSVWPGKDLLLCAL